jgi:hypothetical protein
MPESGCAEAYAINLAEDDRVASVERMIDGKLPAEEVVP